MVFHKFYVYLQRIMFWWKMFFKKKYKKKKGKKKGKKFGLSSEQFDRLLLRLSNKKDIKISF